MNFLGFLGSFETYGVDLQTAVPNQEAPDARQPEHCGLSLAFRRDLKEEGAALSGAREGFRCYF